MNKICVVFDLDDTLYKEIDFLRSGYFAIAKKWANDTDEEFKIFNLLMKSYITSLNPFEELVKAYPHIFKETLLETYRFHKPALKLDMELIDTLQSLHREGVVLGVLTDGRSITQRNKLEALKIKSFFRDEDIVISEEFGSEKPSERNYRHFEELHPDVNHFVYVADNPKKDFVTPNKLGWSTIGIRDDERNIHRQRLDLPEEYYPKVWINSIGESEALIRRLSEGKMLLAGHWVGSNK